jgi:hypothetical protein
VIVAVSSTVLLREIEMLQERHPKFFTD